MARLRMRFRSKSLRNPFFVLRSRQLRQSVRRGAAPFAAALIAAVFIGLAVGGMRSFLYASPFFTVSEIEVIDKYPDMVEYPLARIKQTPNIFLVDLREVSRYLEREYADIQTATVRRVLPNKLQIEVLRRRPVAQIPVAVDKKSGTFTYYLVNEECRILAAVGTTPRFDLPIIDGAGIRAAEVEIGRNFRRSSLHWAMELYGVLQQRKFPLLSRLTRIDVSDARSMSFYIDANLEVKIGNRDLPQRVATLAAVLPKLDVLPDQQYYIDVRFKDFIFAKKNNP
ncbi:MAG: cell division protein FtsQ/DivIB [Candidatus Omnitrophica bacterium]|nr:cell division protein FtsQ/DivIB [Candidatus Omnitrophota bacterium]